MGSKFAEASSPFCLSLFPVVSSAFIPDLFSVLLFDSEQLVKMLEKARIFQGEEITYEY